MSSDEHPRRRALGERAWTADEARTRFDELLLAAKEIGPQEIREGGRRYQVSLMRAVSLPSGKELLRRGGPLADDDSLD